jgi:hypothetical protein
VLIEILNSLAERVEEESRGRRFLEVMGGSGSGRCGLGEVYCLLKLGYDFQVSLTRVGEGSDEGS